MRHPIVRFARARPHLNFASPTFWDDRYADDPDDETLWVHEVVGLAVVDQHGHGHGRVRAVVENPASDLLELEDGRLVPSVFVVDHQPGERLVVEVPDGLLDDRD